jgi:hypothetical protein
VSWPKPAGRRQACPPFARISESATICKQQNVVGAPAPHFCVFFSAEEEWDGGAEAAEKVPGHIVPYCCSIVVPLLFSSVLLFFLRRIISRSNIFF